MLGKRKEKSIRDIATDTIATIEGIVKRIARPRRGTLEREEVERIAAIVVEAIKADMMEWKPVDRTRKTPGVPYTSIVSHFYQYFDDETSKSGELLLEQTGTGPSDYKLVAYLSDAVPYVFCRGTLATLKNEWDNAVKWMEKQFLKPLDPVEPESVVSESVDRLVDIDPQFDKLFGTLETGHGRLVIERIRTDMHVSLVGYLPNSNSHLFRRGTISDCKDAWDYAVEWMTEKFPENKA